ncbi:twin-arginine translocase subunit TatC [Candidatus Thiodictyon syntrophicum]|jgi:sec-independent protein translocase protein TatC|uniref:Sec-independent protein translocase protein TatC n=1 Tax=Candidatus Thiodictyon syntrophicum TaxID=1166950 RepID=A0A2K8U5M3_9GAMM|nr:twin-arginine translocase subunit TatC [Candidatus Thiodictyon syntrophicum]AUB80882.1 twin arginine-targeting protein translocase TatC [Candidatus Thiodictyon syntrophicum]
MAPSTEPDDPGAEQPFLSHLVELRDRLIWMLVGIGVALVVTFPFANSLYTYVAAPLIAKLPQGGHMIATQVISPFLAPFRLALMAAVFLAMPWLLYQLWAFVAPGLYRHEKRLAIPLLASSVVLFYLGMLFAYYLVFPLIFGFMAATTPEGVAMMTDITAYLDFVLALFFAFGVAFEVPVATILLVAIGVTTPDALAAKRPYIIVGAFVVGMVLTPPDVFSQTMLAIPMWLLFELGVFFSRILVRDRAAREAAEAAQAAGPGPLPPPAPPPGRPGGGSQPSFPSVMGDELEPDDPGPPPDWRPLTDEEMESELDRADAEHAANRPASAPTSAPAPLDRVEEKIRRANRLRELENHFAARQVLYEVLEEGDESQRRTARNILNSLNGS